MRRVALALVIVVAAFAGYRYYAASYVPQKAYEKFAEDIVHQRYDEAAKKCDGLTATDLGKSGSQEQIGAGPSMFQTLFPSRFEVQSRETTPEGDLTLHAIQTVRFNPVGIESAIRPAMSAKMQQVVTLRKVKSEWRIVAFENKFDAMDSTSGR